MLFHSIFRNANVTLLCITNTSTMLYAACREKWSFHSGGAGAGGGGETRSPLSGFSGSAPESCSSNSKLCNFNNVLEQLSTCQAVFFQSWTLGKNSSSQWKITANMKDTKNQWKFEADSNTRNQREARARSLRLILILHPIGWKECWKYCFLS